MKKGFTLVELLAVIVILAIILVIAVPQIMDTIEASKKSSLESSTKLVASTLETDYQGAQVSGTTFATSGSCIAYVDSNEYSACTYTISDSGEATVTLTGKDSGKFGGLKASGTKNNAAIVNGSSNQSGSLSLTAKSSLADYTWAEIKQLSDALVAGTITTTVLSSTYNIAIGSTKSATINSESHVFRLVGIKHDVDANDQTLGMTFEQVDIMNNTYAMKSSMTTTDSWSNSDLKTTIDGFTIESNLNAVITSAKKTCVAGVKNSALTYVTSKLWIMSETEIAGTQTRTYGGKAEGTQYAYYITNNTASARKKLFSTGADYSYWLRSPYLWDTENSASGFASVYRNGGSIDTCYSPARGTGWGGVSVCFCI